MVGYIEMISDFGGILWWVLIKFCRTNIDDELSDKKKPRNIICLSVVIILISLIASLL